jgi:uncharacterized protein (DUF983 family)
LRLFWIVIRRGTRGLCPQCAGAPLFSRAFSLAEPCPRCRLNFRKDETDLWSILYLTTALITGLFIIAMLLYRPADSWKGQAVVCVSALGVWLGTYRWRKGFAVALLYYLDWRWNNHGRYRLQGPGVPPVESSQAKW